MCTFVAASNDAFVQMQMASLLQGIQKATKNVARLRHDDMKQLLSCLDGLTTFRMDGLQLLWCKCVPLIHVASDALGIEFLRHFRVYRTQHIVVI